MTSSASNPAKPSAAVVSLRQEKRQREEAGTLDTALEDTFPASDPVAAASPTSSGAPPGKSMPSSPSQPDRPSGAGANPPAAPAPEAVRKKAPAN